MVMNGLLCFILKYNKTNSILQGDKTIFRYLPPQVGAIVLVFISVIRPLQIAFLQQRQGHENQALNLYFACYSINGQIMDSSRYGLIFRKFFSMRRIANLGVAAYRHFIKFIARKEEVDEDEDFCDTSLLAMQFGHSRHVSNHYGSTGNQGIDFRR